MELLFVPKWAERPSLFHSDVPAGAHRALKVTSLALTSASFPQGFKEKRVDCIPSQNVRDAACIAHFFFFLVQLTVTMRIILSKKAIKFFGMNCAAQIHRIYCHITAKLDRFLSEPGQIQVKTKAGCLLHNA